MIFFVSITASIVERKYKIFLIFSSFYKVFKRPPPVPTSNDHYDYEVVNEDELVQDDDEDEDEEEEDNDIDQPEYLRNSPPLSAIDVDIRIVRQKMSFAEASLELSVCLSLSLSLSLCLSVCLSLSLSLSFTQN